MRQLVAVCSAGIRTNVELAGPLPTHSKTVLRPNDTCREVAQADRAAILIDAAAYFAALRSAMLRAKKSIHIVGWDFHSATRLVGADGSASDGAPESLKDFLAFLVDKKPDLKINILLWNYAILYALERETMPVSALNWITPSQISIQVDDALPFGASHHQKIVVVDDMVAFCGGIDLTINRWDTPDHDMANSNRVDPDGTRYRPFHDVQMMVDGNAARAVADLVRERWRASGNRDVADHPIIAPDDDPWPENVRADFSGVTVGIARTASTHGDQPDIREVEALYIASISVAERMIYCENQFFTSQSVGEALANRLADKPDLELVLVGPNVHSTWLEDRSMNTGRRRFMDRFEEMGLSDRVRLFHPALPNDATDQGAMVHAKLMIVDDTLLRVGSANLNNRSMVLDTECDLLIEARNDKDRQAICNVRALLLAEHLGTTIGAVQEAFDSHGSIIAAIEHLRARERTLNPIDLSDVPKDDMALSIHALADPEEPVGPAELLARALRGDLFRPDAQ